MQNLRRLVLCEEGYNRFELNRWVVNNVSLVLRAPVDLSNFIIKNLVQIINIITLESYRTVCEMRVGLYILILPAEVLDERLLLDKGINLILVDRF